MEHEGSLLHSQVPATVSILSQIKSVHAPLTHLPKDPSGTESHVPFPLLRPY